MFAPKTIALSIAAALVSMNTFAAPASRTHDGFVAGAEEAGFSLEQYRYFTTEGEGRGRMAFAQPRSAASAAIPQDGFVFVAGDIGSQPLQHKYFLQAGRLVHSDECDHAVRMVSAPAARDIEAARLFSPGA